MKGEYWGWAVLALILLAGGWLIGRFFWLPPDVQSASDESEFRAWFWEARGIDIAGQVGLIMAGALGVAALLPMNGESADSDEPAVSTHSPAAGEDAS
ncbi:MAG: hypothetical protein JW934_01200 [Anaerolineae bacterium]|nr:hypothetical protein [Anaerolineae bacterium]